MAVKIKICGMKFPENISEIASLQPDYLGFIFYEKSPRYFQDRIPNIDNSIQKVGVFVNATFKEIEEKVKQFQLDLVQLHGNETPDFCYELENNSVKVIKSFSIDNQFNFNTLKKYRNFCSSFLFDTKGKLFGGNGVPFDWSVLENYLLDKPYFLSGGIGIENSTELNEFIKKDELKKCIAIDLNSKFEIEPGLKNKQKLSAFIKNLNQ